MKSTQKRRIRLEMNVGEILLGDQSKELEKYRLQKKNYKDLEVRVRLVWQKLQTK